MAWLNSVSLSSLRRLSCGADACKSAKPVLLLLGSEHGRHVAAKQVQALATGELQRALVGDDDDLRAAVSTWQTGAGAANAVAGDGEVVEQAADRVAKGEAPLAVACL